MTEQEWLASEDPQAMLKLRRTNCCGCWWTDNGNGMVSLCPGAKPCSQCDNGPIFPYAPWSDRKLRLFACACCRQVWSRLNADQRVNVVFAESEPWHQSAAGSIHPAFLSHEAITDYAFSVDEARCLDFAVRWLGAASAREVANQSPEWLQRLMLFQTQANLLRDIVGNPFRPVALADCRCGACVPRGSQHHNGPCAKRRLLTPTVLSLAQAAYEERSSGQKCEMCRGRGGRWDSVVIDQWYACDGCHGIGRIEDGTLDPARLAVLSDALEEAGCGEMYAIERHGQKIVKVVYSTNPLLAHLRSPGPHVRGCWVVDLLLGKE